MKDIKKKYIEQSIKADVAPRNDTGQFKKQQKLTRKQKAFVDELVNNPKQSATEAASKVYAVKERNTAGVIATENLRKPNIVMALQQHADLAEGVMIGVMQDWGRAERPRQREIALNAAFHVHDKIFGKATQKIEQHTEVVRVNINLTGDGEEPPKDL